MNEEYLWDKSGEPDPEIQELEEALGVLRYQPKPLALPKELLIRRRSYLPLLAIAATVVITLLAAAMWLRTQENRVPQLRQAANDPPAVNPTVIEVPQQGVKEGIDVEVRNAPRQEAHRKPNVLARNVRAINNPGVSTLRKREREEALAAKQQLMLALRLASEKLNLAHRKTHGPTPASQIKNQHRVG